MHRWLRFRIFLLNLIPDNFLLQPFELLLGFVTGIGAVYSVVISAPTSISQVFPDRLQVVWSAVMFVGAVALLWGIGRQVSSFEKLGLRLLANAITVWAGAALFYDSTHNFMSALILLALAVALVVRSFAITTAQAILRYQNKIDVQG